MDVSRVEVFLDNMEQPFTVLEKPPFRVGIDPAGLAEGEHYLVVVTYYQDGSSDHHEYVFEVRKKGPVYAGHIARAPLMSPVEVELLDAVETAPPVRPRPVFYATLPALLFLLIAGVATWLGYYGESSPENPKIAPGGVVAAAAPSPAPEAPKAATVDGRALYEQNCASCHQPDGQGMPPTFPALAGNAKLADAEYVIKTVLYGKPGTAMPPFNKLSDEEVAAIASYVRTAWGNDFGPVSPEDVARLRE
jgi:mono/diheme cytochrome c family protein